jgi:hypothetical protein
MQQQSAGIQTGIQVQLTFFPLAFLLLFCTPHVEIDGVVQKRPWGTHFFSVTPGLHRVRIWFPYLIMPQCGLNAVDVDVAAGTFVNVRYFMWPWMFAAGKLEVTPASAVVAGQPVAQSHAAPAAWHADPLGRHEFRYWDGAQWTATVANNGVQAIDPLG